MLVKDERETVVPSVGLVESGIACALERERSTVRMHGSSSMMTILSMTRVLSHTSVRIV